MTFPVAWNKILQLNKDVDALAKDVSFLSAKAKKEVIAGKRSLFFETKEFQFQEDDLTFKTSTLVQSTDGITLLTALTFEVFAQNEEEGLRRRSLQPKPWGFGVDENLGFGISLDVAFDFDYNIVLNASDVKYGQSLRDGVGFLSRTSLGVPVNLNRLDLERPFYLKENEFFSISIKPIRYTMPGAFSQKSADTQYIVSFNAIGYKILGAHTT